MRRSAKNFSRYSAAHLALRAEQLTQCAHGELVTFTVGVGVDALSDERARSGARRSRCVGR